MKKVLMILLLFSMVNIEAQHTSFAKVDSLLLVGRYKMALTSLQNMTPSFSVAYKTATVYDVLDLHKKTIDWYTKALTFKEDYKTKIKLAQSFKKVKKYVQAIALFEEINTTDQQNLLVKYELGKLYLSTKQAAKAKVIFMELTALDPENANYSYRLALAYHLLKKRNQKINTFLDAYRKDSAHIGAIEQLARAFTKLNDKDSANLFVEKGLALNPNKISLNRLKINSLYLKKKYKQSILLLEHIDSLAPNEHYTKKMLGKCYNHTENYDKAIKNFKSATKIDNGDFNSQRYLGDIYLKLDKVEAAMFSYVLATYVGKETRDKAYMGLAEVYTKMKLPNRVLEQYELAIRENYKNYTAHFKLTQLSDNYYKDKKIGYRLYKKYLASFEGKNKEYDVFATYRVKEIKKLFFKNGEVLE